MTVWVTATKEDKKGKQTPTLIDLEGYVGDIVADKFKGLSAGLEASLAARVDGAAPAHLTALGMNLSYYVEGDRLVLVADIGEAALAKAPLSHRGKNKLIASSRGDKLIDGSPIPGLRVALNIYTTERG